MPKRSDIKKVLVIGSGPIVIGQAAEFDYAGTQACRSLKEEGVEVCLVNSNLPRFYLRERTCNADMRLSKNIGNISSFTITPVSYTHLTLPTIYSV